MELSGPSPFARVKRMSLICVGENVDSAGAVDCVASLVDTPAVHLHSDSHCSRSSRFGFICQPELCICQVLRTGELLVGPQCNLLAAGNQEETVTVPLDRGWPENSGDQLADAGGI